MRLLKYVPRRVVTLGGLCAVLLAAGLLQLADANPAASQTVTLNAWQSDKDPGLDPNSSAWKRASFVQVPLTAQAGSYAAGGGSIPVVWARAIHYNNTLYVRVEWQDSTQDETTTKVEDFSDAAAIEFPAKSAASVPAVCMGQADAGVNIWQWRADSDKGFTDTANSYVSAYADEYPSKDDLFFTARAAGNLYAKTDQGPMQNLVAQAFGTLSPASTQDVRGQGSYANGRWAVVFARPFAGGSPEQASFTSGTSTNVAFAVWNGSDGDRNGRKSVSQFVTLSISGAVLPPSEGTNWKPLAIAVVTLVVIAGGGVGLGLYGLREGKRQA